jgi:hypothetical protein
VAFEITAQEQANPVHTLKRLKVVTGVFVIVVDFLFMIVFLSTVIVLSILTYTLWGNLFFSSH